MLKNLVPIVAATLLLLIVWASAVPLFHWFQLGDSTDQLAENQARWRSEGIDSYEYIIQKHCSCGPPGNIPVKVSVRDSLNIAAYDNREPFDPDADKIEGVPHTVSDMFEMVRSAAAGRPALTSVRYDAQFGFPYYVQLDPDADVEGDEIIYSVELFQAVAGEI